MLVPNISSLPSTHRTGLLAQGVRNPLPTLSTGYHFDAHDTRAGACLLVSQRGPSVSSGSAAGSSSAGLSNGEEYEVSGAGNGTSRMQI